jgi:beta-lactamase regulating signal transducer with metallopeptidase domain
MTALLLAILVKGTILMAAAAAVIVLMRRLSAATRHFVWTLTVAGLLLLPAFSTTLPSWQIAVPIVPADASTFVETPRAINTASDPSAVLATAIPASTLDHDFNVSIAASVPWAMLAVAIYLTGGLVLLGRLVAQRRAARRIAGETAAITDVKWTQLLHDCAARIGVVRHVALRRSRVQLMPITMGTIAPVIVVPADADTWDDDRRQAVLLHELAHIARHDCLTQMLCAIACAVYWVNPGVWYVARRLRIEREVACDDRVLAAGARASDYAGHLLELAYTWSGHRAPAMVVGMASSRKLEGRLRSVLDPARNRTMPTRRVWLAGAALTATILLPIAVISVASTTASADVRSTLMGTPVTATFENVMGAAVQAVGSGAQDTIAGKWELRPARTPERVRLRLAAGSFSTDGEIDARHLDRLLPQPLSSTTGAIRFAIRREAGAVEIEGTVNASAGSGTFTFVPSRTFIAGLTARGFSRPTTQQLFELAQQDVGLAFIDELAAQKYAKPDVAEIVRAGHHGVNLDFVREMADAGYRVGTLEALIRFRDHGVSAEFVRELRAQGVSDLPPQDLVRARDHGVDADYVADLKRLGYGQLPFDALIRARDHGVDGEYLRDMSQIGYTGPMQDMIKARDHGVDPEFVRDMRRQGFTLTMPELIRARDHGVTPDYVAAMASKGYKGLPIETFIRLRDHGVTPDYVQEMKERGYDTVSPDEIIRLRDRGAASGYEQHIRHALATLVDHFEHLVHQAFHVKPAPANAR